VEKAIEPLVATGALSSRRVPCLSGRTQPANLAIGSSQRVKMRLHGLNESHAGSIAELVVAWLATSTGVLAARDWPAGLRVPFLCDTIRFVSS
jgi:hypothetical protein